MRLLLVWTCPCPARGWALSCSCALRGVTWPPSSWLRHLRDIALLSAQPAGPPASLAPACSPSGKVEPLPLSRSLLEAQLSLARRQTLPGRLREGKGESKGPQEAGSPWGAVGKGRPRRAGLCVCAEHSSCGEKQKNRLWLDTAQLPPTSKPEATCVYIRSYSQGHGWQPGPKERKPVHTHTHPALCKKKRSLHFNFLTG